MRLTRTLLLLALAGVALSSPVDTTDLKAEARNAPIHPSPLDPVRRDGAHHGGGGGGGHHGGGGGHQGGSGFSGGSGHSSYASAPNSFVSSGGGHHDSGHGKGGGSSFGHIGGGGGGHVGGGHHVASNSIVGSSGGYGAPQQQGYGAPQQQGYYYYYYPVTVEENKKESEGFMGKMKKLFEPMMYPWTAMMDYFGYGDDYSDYDYNDYGSSYGSYARSLAVKTSDYLPWDTINEVGGHVTQGQCLEFYMCELGGYARQYKSLHLLMDYLIPKEANVYARSFRDSMKKKQDCYSRYSCPIIRRYEIDATKQ